VAASAVSPSGGTAPSRARIWSRSARQALITAQLHDAVPIDPPAVIAGGSALSPIRSSTAVSGTASAPAATDSSAVRAPVPMSTAAIDTWYRPEASTLARACEGIARAG